MVVAQHITQELKQIAVGMIAPAPRESFERLITRKRQEQGIPCKENDEPQPVGTHATAKYSADPR